MEAPSEITQRLLVWLALLSTTASTLMKPTGPTFKDDIKQNLKSLSPIYSIAKVLWLLAIALSLRLPRLMSTKLVVWLTLTLYAHWQICEADPSKHMKHKSSVHFARRAILVGVTLPAFVAVVLFDHHRWTQFFMACLLADAVVTEALTLFSPPRPGTIYLRKDWPDNVLLGPTLGVIEISTEIDCGALKDPKRGKAEQKDNTEPEGTDTNGKETSSSQTKEENSEILPPQNLCNKVQRLSDSLLRADIEANAEYEDINEDICTILRLLYPFRITWTCGHRLCFVYKACSFLAPLILLAQRLGAAIFVLGLFSTDVQPLLPYILAVINDNSVLHSIFFFAFEEIFVVFWGLLAIIIHGVLLKRFPKAQSTLDRVSNSLARRSRFSARRIKGHITAIPIIWPLQAYFFVINPVPMTEARLSIIVTIFFFTSLASLAWAVSARLVSKDSEGDEDAKDTSSDGTSTGKGASFQARTDTTFSLLLLPVAFLFLCSSF